MHLRPRLPHVPYKLVPVQRDQVPHTAAPRFDSERVPRGIRRGACRSIGRW